MQSTFTLFTRVFALCGGLLLTVSLQAQCTTNLIEDRNPGFENFNGDGSVAWWFTFGNGSIATNADTPSGGGNSGETVVPATGNQNVYIAQGTLPATDGNQYRLAVDIKVTDAGGVGAYVNIGMNFRTSGADVSEYFKTSVDLTTTDWTLVDGTYTADADDNFGNSPGRENNIVDGVQIYIEVGGGASVLVDNVMLLDVTPPAAPVDCAGTLLNNGNFVGDAASWNNYGSTFAYDQMEGQDCAGAIRGDCVGGGCGTGQYGITAAEGEFYELTYDARYVSGAGFATGQVLFFNSDFSTSFGSQQVPVQGGELIPYRVVAEANDPTVASVAVQFNLGDGTSGVFDAACLRPFTPEPIRPRTGNLVTNGDFENGLDPFDRSEFNFTDVNDPATGLGARAFNNNNYGFSATNNIAIVGGTQYSLLLDHKQVGTVQFSKLNYRLYEADGITEIGGRTDNTLQVSQNTFVANQFDFTVPANAAFISIEYEMSDGGTTGYTVIDNLVLIETAILLPVELTDFSGQNTGKTNRLRWATATEENTEMFYLERSRNGVDAWEQVSMLPAAGNSRVRQEYEVLDAQPFNETYYRLRSVDFDGSEQTFDVIRLTLANTADLRAYPNPVTSQLTVETTLETAMDYQLFDALGRRLLTGRIAAGSVRTLLPTADLPSGRYVLRVGERSISVIK